MSIMSPDRPEPPTDPAPPKNPEFEAQMARVMFHLARAREFRLREERIEAEARRLHEERRPRGFFIGFI